ncbi:sensor histidine kinase [Evansella clarkii]|uniref:sensor histidine kinase n=1 Tax=Evansella clarkii TaxID=79879 RepID=UPI000B42ECF4|nr:sensor histidine kinase [Evansella clarkii]
MAEIKKRFEFFPARYGYYPYIFLLYLLLPAFFIASETGWKLTAGIFMLLLFLVSYRQLYCIESTAKKSFKYWLFAQLTIILLLTVFYNINSIYLGFFSAHFIGWHNDRKPFWRDYSLFAFVICVPTVYYFGVLQAEGLLFYLIFSAIMLFSPFGIRSMNSRMELERQLNEANKQIETLVKREERMRIARDLHDTLGHTLSLITLKAQLVEKLTVKNPDRARLEAKEIERTSRTALSQVRELVSDMRTASLSEVIEESKLILEAASITCFVEGRLNKDSLPGLTENILGMCLREAVTNTVKHSGAENCRIIVEQLAGEVKVTVKDDGKGIGNSAEYGNGLKGMCERLELLDGKMDLVSENGSKLIVSVPVIRQNREAGA